MLTINMNNMKKGIITFFLLIFSLVFLICQTNPNHVWVNGYTRSNGTHVQGHWRTAPNHTNVDNFSTRGNVNPYTHEKGWVTPDGQENPWEEDNELETVEISKYLGTSASNNNITDSYGKSYTYYNTPNSHSSYNTTNSVFYSKGNQVNVRQTFSTNSNIEFRINKGDIVKILDQSEKEYYINGYGTDYWYKIEHNGRTGWVFGKLIESKNNEKTPMDWEGELLEITGNNVNIRSEPSTVIGKVQFQLNKYDKVEVIAKTKKQYPVTGYGTDYWYYIKYNDKFGWVFGGLTNIQ